MYAQRQIPFFFSLFFCDSQREMEKWLDTRPVSFLRQQLTKVSRYFCFWFCRTPPPFFSVLLFRNPLVRTLESPSCVIISQSPSCVIISLLRHHLSHLAQVHSVGVFQTLEHTLVIDSVGLFATLVIGLLSLFARQLKTQNLSLCLLPPSPPLTPPPPAPLSFWLLYLAHPQHGNIFSHAVG